MSRTQQTLDGIVLRTHDVGEADRLCIVLTKERGRMALRARAVRKLRTRIGSLLLPGRRVLLDVREDGGHGSIAAARLNGEIADLSDPMAFVTAQQGIELLLALTEDGEPLPAVFDVLFQFLHACGAGAAHALLPFQMRLFHLLGLLPSHADDRRFMTLNDEERASVCLSATVGDFGVLCSDVESTSGLRAFVDELLETHARRTLKSGALQAAFAV